MNSATEEKRPLVAVIIPALNEERTITEVIEDCLLTGGSLAVILI